MKCNNQLKGFTPLEGTTDSSWHGVKRKKLLTGFTLIEVLVSIFILSLTVTGLFAVFFMGEKTIQTDKNRVKALNYAQETLEELKNYVTIDGVYSHLPNSGVLVGDTSGLSWAFTVSNAHTHNTGVTGFTRTYTVENEGVGGRTLKKVTVTVEYPEVYE